IICSIADGHLMTNTCNLLEEEIKTTPKGPGRAGKDLERINKGMHMKLPIHIFEGKKRHEVPRQAAKLVTQAGIVLWRHIPVLPRWNKLQHEQDHLSNYIKKVSVQFSMDTTSKPVISACADMLKSGQRQMRSKLKKKYFDNVPESQRITKSPMSSMDDNQWAELLKLWSSPQHMEWHNLKAPRSLSETCLANQRNREKVQMYQRTGSRCYVAQAHAVRDKFKDAEPTAVDLFREFRSSRKTGFVSETVQKALDDMEAMMEEPVREGEEPMSPGRAVREVVCASTFLEVVGLQSKKKLRVPVCSRLEALIAELECEKAEGRQVEQIVEQQRREIDALRKQVQEARDSNRTVEAQLEHLRKESAQKASMIACLMSNFEGGQVHPSSLTFE
ncbi:hypothetical protein EJB05_50357, partial [Eragrostis curvula]